jgi:tRNA modification GTPase
MLPGVDTIAAIATPVGEGAIALLRVSGPGALAVAGRLLGDSRTPESFAPRRQYLATVHAPTGAPLDEVLISRHPAPHSYTGEDVVEITCHGGVLLTRRVLEAALAAGARGAHPGEFTQRAFLNGKMDLTQAEAVMDLIGAQTDLALRAASEQLGGRLGQRITALREDLVGLVAHVEAFIDFPEEDIQPETGALLLDRLDGIRGALDELLDTAEQGRILREGVRTVIYGAPNVGKSSLLNALVGHERAIVSELPGTTRDTVEEFINVRGLALHLADTAGLRDSADPLENAGIARTHQTLARADLALHVVDGSVAPAVENPSLPEDRPASGAAAEILVVNKADLGVHPAWRTAAETGVEVSCRSGEGLAALQDAIYQRITGGQARWQQPAVAINARHQACLRRAREALGIARQAMRDGLSPEFAAMDLRAAMEAIGEIVGGAGTEDILGRIFATFCIGK